MRCQIVKYVVCLYQGRAALLEGQQGARQPARAQRRRGLPQFLCNCPGRTECRTGCLEVAQLVQVLADAQVGDALAVHRAAFFAGAQRFVVMSQAIMAWPRWL